MKFIGHQPRLVPESSDLRMHPQVSGPGSCATQSR